LVVDEQRDTELKVTFAMKKAIITYGRLLRQELQLEQLTDFILDEDIRYSPIKWEDDQFRSDGMSNEKSVARLILNAVYRPMIRIFSEIQLEDRNNSNGNSKKYSIVSTMIQECPGKVETFFKISILGVFSKMYF
jgi:hypothetical protein